jgi:hypothetical protein
MGNDQQKQITKNGDTCTSLACNREILLYCSLEKKWRLSFMIEENIDGGGGGRGRGEGVGSLLTPQ